VRNGTKTTLSLFALQVYYTPQKALKCYAKA